MLLKLVFTRPDGADGESVGEATCTRITFRRGLGEVASLAAQVDTGGAGGDLVAALEEAWKEPIRVQPVVVQSTFFITSPPEPLTPPFRLVSLGPDPENPTVLRVIAEIWPWDDDTFLLPESRVISGASFVDLLRCLGDGIVVEPSVENEAITTRPNAAENTWFLRAGLSDLEALEALLERWEIDLGMSPLTWLTTWAPKPAFEVRWATRGGMSNTAVPEGAGPAEPPAGLTPAFVTLRRGPPGYGDLSLNGGVVRGRNRQGTVGVKAFVDYLALAFPYRDPDGPKEDGEDSGPIVRCAVDTVEVTDGELNWTTRREWLDEQAARPPRRARRTAVVALGKVKARSDTAPRITVTLDGYDPGDVDVHLLPPYAGADGKGGVHLVPEVGDPVYVVSSGHLGHPPVLAGIVRMQDATESAPYLGLDRGAWMRAGDITTRAVGKVTVESDLVASVEKRGHFVVKSDTAAELRGAHSVTVGKGARTEVGEDYEVVGGGHIHLNANASATFQANTDATVVAQGVRAKLSGGRMDVDT